MKKLMIAAAAAAMVGGAYAEAQVYDVSLSVKSTKAMTGKTTTKKNPFVDEDGTIVYRAQASYTWKGLIWGCSCNSISGQWGATGDGTTEAVAGNVLWDAKTGALVWDGNDEQKFGWKFINAIGLNGEKSEGTWEIGNEDDDTSFYFLGSGFGTTKYAEDCNSNVSLSGSFAGWMPPLGKEVGECLFCGDTTGENPSEAWDFCDCETFVDAAKTAAYGTWSVKLNKSLSTKLSSKTSILDVYNFKKLPAVAARIAELEDEVRQGGEPTECDDIADAIAAKKAEIKTVESLIDGSAYIAATNEQAAARAKLATLNDTEMDFASYKLNPAQGKMKVSDFDTAYWTNVGDERFASTVGTDKYSQICNLTNKLAVAYNANVAPIEAYINYVQTNKVDTIVGDTEAQQAEIKVWKQFIVDLKTFDNSTGKTLAIAEGKVTGAVGLTLTVPPTPAGMNKALLVPAQNAQDEMSDNTAKAIEVIKQQIAAWDAALEATGLNKAAEDVTAANKKVAESTWSPTNETLWLAQKSVLQSELRDLQADYEKAGCED